MLSNRSPFGSPCAAGPPDEPCVPSQASEGDPTAGQEGNLTTERTESTEGMRGSRLEYAQLLHWAGRREEAADYTRIWLRLCLDQRDLEIDLAYSDIKIMPRLRPHEVISWAGNERLGFSKHLQELSSTIHRIGSHIAL
jgi:hypothetical protein